MSMLLSAFAGVLAVTVVIATFYFIRQASSSTATIANSIVSHTRGFRARQCAHQESPR